MENLTYFDRLHGSVSRIARHAFYPGKEEAVEQCLDELDHLRTCGRITDDQLAVLREVLLGDENSCLLEGVARERSHPEVAGDHGGIAILCQGEGSHAAFSAGVLQGLLAPGNRLGRIRALAGTSYGAVNALLAWEGLLRGDRLRSVSQLEAFWKSYSAQSLIDALFNYTSQMVQHLRAVVPYPGLAQGLFFDPGCEGPRAQLERLLDPGLMRSLAAIEGAPRLFVASRRVGGPPAQGAGAGDEIVDFLPPDAGSSASQRAAAGPAQAGAEAGAAALLRAEARLKPGEIWLIRVESGRPDRQAPASGGLAGRACRVDDPLLEQELRFIGKINDLIASGSLVDRQYRRIEVHQIIMEHDLDETSKSDRSPSFIGHLLRYGRDRARQFLELRNQLQSHRVALPLGG